MTIKKILASGIFVLPLSLLVLTFSTIYYKQNMMTTNTLTYEKEINTVKSIVLIETKDKYNIKSNFESTKIQEAITDNYEQEYFINPTSKMQKLAIYISENYQVPIEKAENIVQITFLEAVKKDLDPTLVLSIIGVESTFKQYSKSPVGAVGLTQVMEKVHHKKIKENKVDIWSVHGNIRMGTDILKEYLDLSDGNLQKALQRYNGSSKDKTYKYSKKVMKKMEKLMVASR